MVTLYSGVFTKAIQADTSGRWEIVFPLQNGINDLRATAVDRAGQVSPPSARKRVVVLVEPPLYTVGLEPDIAGLGSTVNLDATARDDKPVEGLPTRWITATLSTGDVLGLNLTGSAGPTGTWQATWPVQPGADGERVVDFRGEDEGGQVGHGETALVIDTLLPGPPWMSSPRGTTWVGRPQVTVVGQGAPLNRLQMELDGSPANSTIIDANGEWVIEQPLSGREHRLRTRLTDLAGNQSGFSNQATVKVDLEPPQVTLSAPPVSEGSFTVEWDGDDGDGSGVIAYQVDYQDNGGPWRDWLTETLDLEAPFSGQLYHEYTFRVQARDLVGHTSDWITTTVAIVNQTKYYFLDGRRIAMRKGDKVYYLYGDHLGSTSLTTDADGEVVYKAGYLPYGGGRLSDGISPTDFGFTDQRNEVGLRLYDYNARYFDPFLGRFISPDPIAPNPTNGQAFDRYAYVYNNPIRYTDPRCQTGCENVVRQIQKLIGGDI